MSPGSDVSIAGHRYPLHSRALDRHAKWARDFAAASDLASAHAELLDIAAIAAELHDDEPVPNDPR